MLPDVYPLSPIQQGMLFHWLLDRNAGTDIEQIVGDLQHGVDAGRLHRAWQQAVDRFDVLRTAFAWEGAQAPVQMIMPRVVLPFTVENLGDLDPATAGAHVQAYLEEDRRKGFDLSCAPAMRIALFQLAPEHFRIVWSFHHILIDGRSFERILNSVFGTYDEAEVTAGEDPKDQPYREYAEWTQRQDTSDVRQFWRQRLRGFSAPTPIQYDSVADAKTERFGQSDTRISVADTAQLRRLSASQGLSLNTIVMAAWALLLSKYSGETDVVFGATKSTRRGSVPGVENAVGLFLATIPVRIAVEPSLSVVEWLQKVRAEWVSLRGREHLPLVDIKSVSELPAAAPVFETLVVFENYQFGTRLQAQGGSWATRHFHILEQTNFPLTLMAYDDASLAIKIDYDARRFEPESITRLTNEFVTILEGWATDAAAPVWSTPVLPVAERRMMLETWNATDVEIPHEQSLAQLIEAQVARAPERVAVVHEGRTLTYEELNRRANQLAHELIRRGVGPDILVGVCLDRSPELLIALLAVVKSGGAYVPLDPGFPAERLGYMAHDAGLVVLLTEPDLAGAVSGITGDLLHVRGASVDTDSDAAISNPIVPVSAQHLAYVLYTSGSTGKPKGVEVTRGAFVNFLEAMRGEPGLGEEDVLLAVTTISFDIAGLEIFLPLLVGARIVLASRAAAADGEALRALIETHGATVLQATPATWRLLLAAGWIGSADFTALCGGEAVSPELTTQLAKMCGSVWNMYGPTETTVWSSVQQLRADDRTVLIGRPIANTTMYVLDAHQQPVPIGVAGELYIGGAGVARGYRNRPDLTAEKFLRNPLRPGERIYRTGDVARYWPDGNLECLGRTDHQVKIRGYRIELGEIEAAILSTVGAAHAVVIAREDTPGNKRLVAYLVPSPGNQLPEAAELRSSLKATLPDYMIPSAFVTLPALPLTPNGKLDRNALPAPDASTLVASSAPATPPRTYTEGLLKDIWEDLFQTSGIGVEDDFFDLGGHSLLAVQLMSRIKNVFGKQIALNSVFESPTLEALAKHIEDDRAKLGLHSLVSIRAAGSRPPLYWIPGGAALGLFSARGVLTRLRQDQPVYGLGSMAPRTVADVETVEQRARNYVELIRRQQPHGPYLLAGFCAGGRVVYEMAQQLTAGGEEVAFVGLVNCWFPRFPDTSARKLRFKAQRLLYQAAAAKREGLGILGYAVKKIQERRAARTDRERVAVSRREVQERGFNQGDMLHNRVLLDATVEVFERYQPRPYAGRLTLFVSSEDDELVGVKQDLDPRFVWARYAAECDTRVFPGGHLAVVEMPHAVHFAAAIQAALDRALPVSAELVRPASS